MGRSKDNTAATLDGLKKGERGMSHARILAWSQDWGNVSYKIRQNCHCPSNFSVQLRFQLEDSRPAAYTAATDAIFASFFVGRGENIGSTGA
jgi:hypothetical protein